MNERLALSEADQRRIDTLTDEINFRELTDMASQVCFGKKLNFEKYQMPDSESAHVIAKLGSRGLRSMLNSDQPHQDPFFEDRDEFVDEPNLQVIYEAKQFGQELLDTAYKCLGDDVYEKIDEYKNAQSYIEKTYVLEWLYNRLVDITVDSAELEDGDDESLFYHPIRLSPKAIGVYPNNNVKPTCLGVSVIAASFLEQAGVEHFHAGAIRNGTQQAIYTLSDDLLSSELESNLTSRLSDSSTTLDSVSEKILESASQTMKSYTVDGGYHAFNVIKIDHPNYEDSWILFDPNFGILINLLGEDEISRASTNLTRFENEAPGLELTVGAISNVILNGQIDYMSMLLDFPEPKLDDVELRSIFTEEYESVVEKLRDFFIKAVIVNAVIETAKPSADTKDSFDADFLDNIVSGAENVFEKCLDDYVLSGNTIYDVQERCRIDKNYLNRRIDDMRSLWAAMIPAIIVNYAQHVIEEPSVKDMHCVFELGLSAQRIGLAVLTDFDVHCDFGISPSFWMSNWPSQIPVIDSAARPSGRIGQNSVTKKMVDNLLNKDLLYAKSYGIIKEFLADHTDCEGGEEYERN